jgi:hypothetical protein
MGYFRRGWLKFSFLVGPEILRNLLTATKPVLVITNGRVLADYNGTSVAEYIQNYSRYLEAILTSPESARRAAMETCMGLAGSLDRFSPEPCADSVYKVMQSDEPVVNLSPQMLDYHGGHLRTNVLSELYFGLELSFPRRVSLDRDRHEVLYDSAGFQTRAIFEDVKSRIQKITTPCKIRSPSRVHRTSIRITKEMQERMRQHPGLKAAHLEIV